MAGEDLGMSYDSRQTPQWLMQLYQRIQVTEQQVQKLTNIIGTLGKAIQEMETKHITLEKKVNSMSYRVNEIAATTDIDMREDVDRIPFE